MSKEILSNQIKIELFPFQVELLKCLNKYDIVTMAIGRRMGKSYAAALAAILHCLKAKPDQPRRVLIVGPTSDIVRESYWSQLAEFLVLYKPFVQQVRQREKEITFKNGSIISLKSADKPDTLRGISGKASVSFIILDEFSFLRDAETLYEEVILPYRANNAVNCKFLCISTPKGQGNFFHRMYERCLDPKNTNAVALHYSCYEAQPHLKEQFDKQKAFVSEKSFKQEYLAEFIGSGNSAFYAFDRKIHVDKNIKDIQPGEPLVIGLDANFGLMTNIIGRVKVQPEEKNYRIEIIREVEGKHKNIDQLISDYNKVFRIENKNDLTVCPDASLNQRSYSASIGVTGLSRLREAGWQVKVDKKNPSYLDSVNAVNTVMMTADGKINLKIHPSCTKLIQSIEMCQWAEVEGHKLSKTSTSAEGHIQDCLRYLVWQFRSHQPHVYLKRTVHF